MSAMTVTGLWRYPVKSMQGESLDALELSRTGVAGDRRFGVFDEATATVVSAKKDGRLLQAEARLAAEGVAIRLPDGASLSGPGPEVDEALTRWLGRPVLLAEATVESRGMYEMPIDFEDDGSEPVQWRGPTGAFVDSSPLHILTTASLRAVEAEQPGLQWDTRRFRPNILLEADGVGCIEQEWIGSRVTIGDVELDVYKPCSRCVMTTRDQPGGLERQLDILRHINKLHATNLGVRARVVRGGRIELGDKAGISPG